MTRHDDRPAPAAEGGSRSEATPKGAARRAWYHRPGIVAILALVVIVGLVGGALYWRHSRTRESTDDAYVDVVSEQVSARIAGQITRVLVTDNQDVHAGDVLVELDPADSKSALERATADRRRAEAQLAQATAQRAAASAQLGQVRANRGVAEANEKHARDDLRRYRTLEDAGALSQQQLDTAQTNAKDTAAQLTAAQRAIGAAAAQVTESVRQIAAAQAGIQAALAQENLARRNLSYTQIRANLDGRVTNRSAAAGNYVQPGTVLMVIVPVNVYVTANFKETQLAHMRRGQAAEVEVDAYPDMTLHGHVDSVQAGSGQAFSLLPAQNASGNWVKIVQRVPVKIALDAPPRDPERRLGPGMSAEVTVQVR